MHHGEAIELQREYLKSYEKGKTDHLPTISMLTDRQLIDNNRS